MAAVIAAAGEVKTAGAKKRESKEEGAERKQQQQRAGAKLDTFAKAGRSGPGDFIYVSPDSAVRSGRRVQETAGWRKISNSFRPTAKPGTCLTKLLQIRPDHANCMQNHPSPACSVAPRPDRPMDQSGCVHVVLEC